MGLTQEQIRELLGEQEKLKQPRYPPRVQKGPLRYYDHEMRCTSKGCGCATYMKVEHIPRCSVHALRDLNELVNTLTDRLVKEVVGSNTVDS